MVLAQRERNSIRTGILTETTYLIHSFIEHSEDPSSKFSVTYETVEELMETIPLVVTKSFTDETVGLRVSFLLLLNPCLWGQLGTTNISYSFYIYN